MKYDLIFGLGPACSCSQTLRRADLQLLSFPFDWIGPDFGKPGWDDDVRRRTDLICGEFRDWLHREDFRFRAPHPTNGKDVYFNVALNLCFPHDFPQGIQLEESYPAIQAKYKRRTQRFLNLLSHARRVLVVRVDRPDLSYRTPLTDCRYALERLSRKFPHAQFDFLLLQPAPDIPFEKRTIEHPEDQITTLAFDYQDRRPGSEAFPQLDLTARAVAKLFSVRDYRTNEEKQKKRETERRRLFAEFGVNSVFQLRIARLKRSLLKRLPGFGL